MLRFLKMLKCCLFPYQLPIPQIIAILQDIIKEFSNHLFLLLGGSGQNSGAFPFAVCLFRYQIPIARAFSFLYSFTCGGRCFIFLLEEWLRNVNRSQTLFRMVLLLLAFARTKLRRSSNRYQPLSMTGLNYISLAGMLAELGSFETFNEMDGSAWNRNTYLSLQKKRRVAWPPFSQQINELLNVNYLLVE